MSNATIIRNEQQADLLKQLEKVGAPTTTSSDSLDALKSNSALAKGVLEAMGEWEGAAYNFNSMRPATTKGTRVVK